MAGVKGRSGRKRQTVNSDNGKAKLDMLLPEAIVVIENAVEEGNVEISKWVVEMRLGKPRQQVDATVQQIGGEVRDILKELNQAKGEGESSEQQG